MPETLGAMCKGQSSVQVLMHLHRAAGQGGAPAHRFNLQPQVLDADRIVAVDGAFEWQGEDQVQISAGAAYKRTATLHCRHLKASVELGDVVLPQEAIGRLQAANSAQPQLLRQAPLPGAEVALRTTTCLWRVGRNHLHAQLT